MNSKSTGHRYQMVGQQIKAARHKANLPPNVIAALLGYADPGVISDIEDGDLRVPLDRLPQLAMALKLPLYRLEMIVEGYYPGFTSKACEIVGDSIEPCPEKKVSMAIVLSAIQRQSRLS